MFFSRLLATSALFSAVYSYAHYAGSSSDAAAAHAKLAKDLRKRQIGVTPTPVGGLAGTSGSDGSADPIRIGDLRTGAITKAAVDVEAILFSDQSGETDETGTPPADISECDTSTDPCCNWWFISKLLTENFVDPTNGQCNDLARNAIRLGFHDAGTWSASKASAGQDFGGADGSFVLFNEVTRPENNGLQPINDFAIDVWSQFNVGMADLIQYMAIHATVTCPLGPRVRMFVGRLDATQQSLDNLLPDVHASADDLIALFEDKTIAPHDLAALLGAHSTSKQFHVDSATAGFAQDTTPGLWDIKFFNETLQKVGPDDVFKFPSDVVLANDPRVNDEWVAFSHDQDHWNEDFARSYTRLSLLGVNNIADLTECSATLPPKQNTIPVFNATSNATSTSSSMSSTISSSSLATSFSISSNYSISFSSNSSSASSSWTSVSASTTASSNYSASITSSSDAGPTSTLSLSSFSNSSMSLSSSSSMYSNSSSSSIPATITSSSDAGPISTISSYSNYTVTLSTNSSVFSNTSYASSTTSSGSVSTPVDALPTSSSELSYSSSSTMSYDSSSVSTPVSASLSSSTSASSSYTDSVSSSTSSLSSYSETSYSSTSTAVSFSSYSSTPTSSETSYSSSSSSSTTVSSSYSSAPTTSETSYPSSSTVSSIPVDPTATDSYPSSESYTTTSTSSDSSVYSPTYTSSTSSGSSFDPYYTSSSSSSATSSSVYDPYSTSALSSSTATYSNDDSDYYSSTSSASTSGKPVVTSTYYGEDEDPEVYPTTCK